MNGSKIPPFSCQDTKGRNNCLTYCIERKNPKCVALFYVITDSVQVHNRVLPF